MTLAVPLGACRPVVSAMQWESGLRYNYDVVPLATYVTSKYRMGDTLPTQDAPGPYAFWEVGGGWGRLRCCPPADALPVLCIALLYHG